MKIVGADLHAVAVLQHDLARDLLVVAVGAVGAAVVDDEPRRAALLEVGVPARDRVAVEHDVVVGAATDARRVVARARSACRGAWAPSCR